jgi:hypothetical protein
MRFEFFCQALRVSYPGTSLTLAYGFIVPQLAVYGLDQPNAVAKRSVERVDRFFFKIREIAHTANPMTFSVQVALMTSLTGRFKQTVVRTVVFFHYFLYQYSRIRKCLNQLSSHDPLPTRLLGNLMPSQNPVYSVNRVCGIGSASAVVTWPLREAGISDK